MKIIETRVINTFKDYINEGGLRSINMNKFVDFVNERTGYLKEDIKSAIFSLTVSGDLSFNKNINTISLRFNGDLEL